MTFTILPQISLFILYSESIQQITHFCISLINTYTVSLLLMFIIEVAAFMVIPTLVPAFICIDAVMFVVLISALLCIIVIAIVVIATAVFAFVVVKKRSGRCTLQFCL